MAEQIPTALQEEFSLDFFDLFLKNNWNVSDRQYRELLVRSFGRHGKFPFATNFPNTSTGLRNKEEWRSSFEKQCLGLQQYMISHDVPSAGWKWSRGTGMMGFLNSIASQRCGVSTLDTWNPMDIVAVKSSKENIIVDEIEKDVINGVDEDINKDLLNGIMIKYVKSKDLMPISLKKINSNERGAFEESDNLKGPGSKRKHKLDLTYSQIICDLEWSTYKNEWKNAQEVSFTMTQKGSVTRAGVVIRVQARAFQGNNSREKPQHSLAQQGAGAMLGKTSITDLEKFVTDYKVSKVLSPIDHPKIPAKGRPWTKQDKDYWIARYNSLKSISIDGKKINFNLPGSYGEGMRANIVYAKDSNGKKTKQKLTGFAAALESACEADEQGTRVKGDPGRVSGSRLTAKLWGMEWLWRYYNMSMRGTWDAFCYRMIKASKKELSDTGPFIKILGEQGRSRANKRLRMQQLIEDDPNMNPIYDPELANKNGVIPESKKKVSNIVGYESDDPEWDKLLADVQFGEMRGLKKNTST